MTSTKIGDFTPNIASWRPPVVDVNQLLVQRLGKLLKLPLQTYTFIPWESIDLPDADCAESILLGRGSQGETFRASFNGRPVAVKLGHRACILSEALFSMAFNHASVISCVGWTAVAPSTDALASLAFVDSIDTLESSGWVFAGVYEFCENSDLESFLGANPAMRGDVKFLARTFDTILSALERFEKLQIVHGDVKCTNVLVTGALQAKVSDLGLIQAVRDSSSASRLSHRF